MEKLQDLSQSELQELLDNAERVESMALESDEIQNIQLEREMALASNRSLAEQNLDTKPRLEQQKDHLVERYSQLEAVRDIYRQHCATRDGMAGQVTPEVLFSTLQTEGANTEAESEALADEFLEGSLSLDSFLERFLSLRSLAHRRRVRIEKFQEFLRQRSDGAADHALASASACAGQEPGGGGAEPHGYQNAAPPGSSPAGRSSPAAAAAAGGGTSGLPYGPYPVSGPPVAAAANAPAQFPPYPSAGAPYSPAAGYSGPRPAFGPATSTGCPYPTQPVFPSPHPGSAFGQYTPGNQYSASYSYGGYSYQPAGQSSQPQTGRPICRPGYGVPQPYS